jgi:glycosyltransferase involved in cell wall biosynthesis
MSTLFIHGSADLYGSAKILLQIVKVCVREKEDVVVILPHHGTLVKELEDLGIDVCIVNVGVLRRRYFTPWGILGRVMLWLSATYKITRLIKRYSVSTIYINSANVILGPILKWLTGLPLIWHLHEIVENPSILKYFLVRLIEKSNQVIAVSDATRDFWMKQSTKLNIHLLHNGIPTSDFKHAVSLNDSEFPFTLKNTNNAILIAMVGRVQPWKGQAYFLNIMKSFFDEMKVSELNVYAIMVGDAYPGYEYYVAELKQSIVDNELGDKVFYIGYRRDIPAILASIDLLVLPSLLPDPLPTVVLEAMASGKPVLATLQGGASEMILEGETGAFMPLDDHKKAAETLRSLLLNTEKMREMGQKGNQRVNEYFSLEAFESNWLKLFRTF